MLFNSECFKSFVGMIKNNEEIYLMEGRDYTIDANGVVTWVGEYHHELTKDSLTYLQVFNSLSDNNATSFSETDIHTGGLVAMNRGVGYVK